MNTGLITIEDVIKKFSNDSMFIGDFAFLDMITDNEEDIKRYMVYKYGKMISGYYTDNSVSDIQLSILSFNIVHSDFFNKLYEVILSAFTNGNFDRIEDITKDFGIDGESMVYGAKTKTLNFGANHVASSTTGGIDRIEYKQGMNSSAFRPDSKDSTDYRNYNVVSDSNAFVNSETEPTRTDSKTRQARQDKELKKTVMRNGKEIILDFEELYEVTFIPLYLKRLVDYMGIGVYR